MITSVGSPADVVGELHESGTLVLHDVASMRHVDRAIDAGVDGLVLLAAGAGGQTGWANPLVFARAVRARWDGLLVLAGGITDGTSLLAALVAGYDLVSVGTPFIATTESAASGAYKEAVVEASMDDIEVTDALTGLASSMIRTGVVPTSGPEVAGRFDARTVTEAGAGGSATPTTARYSAGQSTTCVDSVVDVHALVARFERELETARQHLSEKVAGSGDDGRVGWLST